MKRSSRGKIWAKAESLVGVAAMCPLISAKWCARLGRLVLIAMMLGFAFGPAVIAREPAPTAHMIKQRVPDFEAGARINVCWRKVPPGNPFTASAEKGKRIIYKKAEIMAEFINEVKKIKVEVKNRDYWNRTFRPM